VTARRAISAREAARLRRALLQERASLHHELASLQGSGVRPLEWDEKQELASLLARALRDVEDALTRLARGTFGRCEACGRRIPAEAAPGSPPGPALRPVPAAGGRPVSQAPFGPAESRQERERVRVCRGSADRERVGIAFKKSPSRG
jgi:hypothetical protein